MATLWFMLEVAAHDTAILLPIIEAHVTQNTLIHSDQWRAYNQFGLLAGVSGYATVYHSLQFLDSATGTPTHHIESYWNHVKLK